MYQFLCFVAVLMIIIPDAWAVTKVSTGVLPIASQAEAEAGTSSTTIMTPQRVQQASSSFVVPPGAVMGFATSTCPTGWVAADGSAVSRTVTYDGLFASISDDYGSGDNSTTFNLPDYRGQFLRGVDGSAGVDPNDTSRTDRGDGTTGDVVGTKQTDAFESHLHNFMLLNRDTGVSEYYKAEAGDSAAANYQEISTNNTGGNETRPTNIYVTYCIKY